MRMAGSRTGSGSSATVLATANQLIYALDGKQLKVIDASVPSAPVQIGALSGVAAAG